MGLLGWAEGVLRGPSFSTEQNICMYLKGKLIHCNIFCIAGGAVHDYLFGVMTLRPYFRRYTVLKFCPWCSVKGDFPESTFVTYPQDKCLNTGDPTAGTTD